MRPRLTALAAVAALALDARAAVAQNSHQPEQPTPAVVTPVPADHASMDHSAMGHTMPVTQGAQDLPREPIPPLTDADRAAAFPDVSSHLAHETRNFGLVQLNRFETWDAGDGGGLLWEGQGWFGGDLNKLWVRSEGERVDGATEAADVEVFYGRTVARWWDVVTGVRQDFDPGSSQAWAAVGVVGLAPQKFEISATAYVGDAGRTAARLEVEYDLLLTNRLIAQPLLELNLLGEDDPERRLGSGVTTAEIGLRLRYEVTRRFAPYLGVVYERAYGSTADFRQEDGEHVDDTRVVAGLRVWF